MYIIENNSNNPLISQLTEEEKVIVNRIKSLVYFSLYTVVEAHIAYNKNEGLTNKDEVLADLRKKDIHFEKVEYDKQQINYFFARKSLLEKANTFQKRYSTKCNWCPLKKFCKTNGVDRSELK